MANDPVLAFLEPVAAAVTPAEAYASHRERTVGLAKFFASRRPLSFIVGHPDEDNMATVQAHLHAARDDPGFAAPGEEPSLTLAPKILFRLTRSDRKVGTRGDYDMALKGLMAIVYRYRDMVKLNEGGVEKGIVELLYALMPPGLSGGHSVELETVDALGPVYVPETENHLLMIESTRYLHNQLLLEQGAAAYRCDNNQNGLGAWLLDYLHVLAKHDFLEFNGRPYSRLSIHALLNLHEFALDEPIRVAAQILLDYVMTKAALSSNRNRRVTPFRRLQHRISHVASPYNDLWHDLGDPMHGFLMGYFGGIKADWTPGPVPERLAFNAVTAGVYAYRPPVAAYMIATQKDVPAALHKLYHGHRPRLRGSDDEPEGGLEIYYKSPSFLMSAGGSFLNSGYGFDELSFSMFDLFPWVQSARAQATTLIPTGAEIDFADLIRFEAFPDPAVNPYYRPPHDEDSALSVHSKGINTGVGAGFMCGGNLRPSEKKTFEEYRTEKGLALAAHSKDGVENIFAAWRGENAQITVAKTYLSTVMKLDGIERFERVVALPAATSDVEPAIASHGGRLYLAWKGTGEGRLNLAVSDDDGATFGNISTFGDSSDHAPALVSHNGQLFYGWTGTGEGKLNVGRIGTAPDGKFRLEAEHMLGDSSDVGPALASHGGRLFLAWRGTGDGLLNIIVSANNGANFAGGKKTFEDHSELAPALAVHAGALFLGWTGTGEGRLNVGRVVIDGAGTMIGLQEAMLAERSEAAPGLASARGKLFLGWSGIDESPYPNVMFSPDGSFVVPNGWIFPDTTSLGFHTAIHRLRVTGHGDEGLPDNFAVVNAVETSAMDAATFRQRTEERNRGLPQTFEYGSRYAYHTPDDKHFTFWVRLESNKWTPRVVQEGMAEVDDYQKLPLAQGPYLSAPGHDGLIEIRQPGCATPLVLDYRNPQQPVRTDNALTCPAPWAERADALTTLAARLAQRGRQAAADQALADAAGIRQMLGISAPPGSTGDTLAALAQVGVDYSVTEAEIREWLADPVYGPYPAFAGALLQLLGSRGLKQPVFIDVIRYFYEDVMGAPSPRAVADVHVAVLTEATLSSFNQRYGTVIQDYAQILR